ncbi:hypothetical protein [Ferrovibrio terrae]|uniref:hypothetical protein n=1 Tax=Ferrovibrio terrae TaxID=2594003 RepID=UPI0031380BD3
MTENNAQPQHAVQKAVPMAIPEYYASGVQIGAAANTVAVIFSRNVPAPVPDTGDITSVSVPTVVMHMSIQTLKDLAVLANETVQAIEKQYGVVETDFLRGRSVQK